MGKETEARPGPGKARKAGKTFSEFWRMWGISQETEVYWVGRRNQGGKHQLSQVWSKEDASVWNEQDQSSFLETSDQLLKQFSTKLMDDAGKI